ncbi:MAG TPA: hypothetical protein VKH44_07900, partial [Pirellulaceae bacterium]|nr:hypothetical protein [Pirellulaceae bacterium]
DATGKAKKSKKKAAAGDETIELFNLSEDPYEKTNLAERQPEKVRELMSRLSAYAQAAVFPKSAPQAVNFQAPKVWGE